MSVYDKNHNNIVIGIQLIKINEKKKKKRILEWVAISFSRESSPPRDPTWVACIAGGFLSELHSRWWFYISINHFYFWPDWIFLAAHRLPMFAGSQGYFSLGSKVSRVFSWCSAPLCRLTGFRSISFYVCVCVCFLWKLYSLTKALQRVTCRPASRQPARLSGWVQSFQERGVSAGPGWAEQLAGATRPSLGLRACACGVPSWSRGSGARSCLQRRTRGRFCPHLLCAAGLTAVSLPGCAPVRTGYPRDRQGLLAQKHPGKALHAFLLSLWPRCIAPTRPAPSSPAIHPPPRRTGGRPGPPVASPGASWTPSPSTTLGVCTCWASGQTNSVKWLVQKASRSQSFLENKFWNYLFIFGSADLTIAFVWAICSQMERKHLFLAVRGFSLWCLLLSSSMDSTLVAPRLGCSGPHVGSLRSSPVSPAWAGGFFFYFFLTEYHLLLMVLIKLVRVKRKWGIIYVFDSLVQVTFTFRSITL